MIALHTRNRGVPVVWEELSNAGNPYIKLLVSWLTKKEKQKKEKKKIAESTGYILTEEGFSVRANIIK